MKFAELEQDYLAGFALAYQNAIDSLPHNSPMREMISYQFHTGGKRIRPLAAILAAQTIDKNIALEQIMPWAVAVELIHNATLIHDDIQDGDEMRRGEPTLWKKYSTAQAINCGDALFFLAQKILYRYEPLLRLRLLQLLQDKTLAVIDGQSQEFALKEQAKNSAFQPDIQEYEQMVMGKTSALFAMPVVGGAMIAGADAREIMQLEISSRAMGLFFQVQDDWIDLWGEKGRAQVGADIAEGKISFPLLLAWQTLAEQKRHSDLLELRRILFAPREATKAEEIKWAISLFSDLGISPAVTSFLETLSVRSEVGGRIAPIPAAILARLNERKN